MCDAEYKALLPQLAVLYYAGKHGLGVKTDDESAIGIPLETYIPAAGIAIEAKAIRNSKHWREEYGIKRVQCKKQGIDLYTITDREVEDDLHLVFKGDTPIDLLKAILTAFQRSNIFISADPEKDIEVIRQNFYRWRHSNLQN